MNSVYFILRNQHFPIPADKDIFMKMSVPVFSSLFNDKKYLVQSDVQNDIFQSFIDYLRNDKIPDIQIENFYEYYLISQEFGVFNDIIEQKRKLYGDYIINLTSLQCKESKYKYHYTEQIALELDTYLEKYNKPLFKLPFQILYNIFYHEKRNLTKVNLAYELIKLKASESNNLCYFSLLGSLDGNQFSQKNLEECLMKLNERSGFMPNIEFKFLEKVFKNQKDNEEQIKLFNNKTNEMKENFSIELKKEIEKVRSEIDVEIDELKNELKKEIDNICYIKGLQKELKSRNKELENEINKIKNEQIELKKLNFEFKNEQIYLLENSRNMVNEIKENTEYLKCMTYKFNDDKQKLFMNEMTHLKSKIEKNNSDQKNKMNSISTEIDQIKNEIKKLKEQKNEKLINVNDINNNNKSITCPGIKELLEFYSKPNPNINSLQKIKMDKSESESESYTPNNKILPTEPSISGPGLLNQLKIIENSLFDPLFVTSLSSCDIYNVIDPNTNDDIGFGSDGDFFIQFELKEAVSINGLKIVSSKMRFLRSFDIKIDGKTVKSIKNARELNGSYKEMKIEIEKINGRIIRIVQTGPNWDTGTNFVNVKRIEILSDDKKYSKGVFATLIENCPTKDPHKCSVHISAKNYDFNSYIRINSKLSICTSFMQNSWFQIELTKGKILINGFRLKKTKSNKLKSFKIIGTDDIKKPLDSWITLIEINEKNINEHQMLDVYKINQPNKPLKIIRLVQTGPNWNNQNFLMFHHFDIFGTYI